MPKLSIIVPVYNAEDCLDRAVDSVAAQTFSDWELILVDDGSKDASPALCDSRAAKDGRIRVIHQDNAGPSAARNRGLEAAAGEFVAFVDADDRLAPEMYEVMFRGMESGNGDCACCGYIPVSAAGEGETVPAPLPLGVHGQEEIREAIVLPLLQDRLRDGAFTGMVWRWLLRRAEIEALSLWFQGGYYEDEMFLIHYFSRPRRLACVPKGLYYYYETPTSVIHRWFPGFTEHYQWILNQKAEAVREYQLPVRADWQDNCAWAGLLADVGIEFAPGGPTGLGNHLRNLKKLYTVPEYAHALAHYIPEGMNRRKTVVASLLRRRLLLPLVLLYTVKNRNR